MALVLVGGVAVAYAGMAPDLIRGSEAWHKIAAATFVGLGVVALPLAVFALRRRQWLAGLLAGAVGLHAPGFFVLQRTLFTPEHRFALTRARWEARGEVYPHELADTFLHSPATVRQLAQPDVREFLLGRLDFTRARSAFDLDDMRLVALLAWEGYRQTGVARPVALLASPEGHRLVTALLLNEIRPVEPVAEPEWVGLEVAWGLRPTEGLAFGLLSLEDVRAYSAQAMSRLAGLSVQEVELLALLHTRLPLRVADEDFGRLVERLAELKPHHAASLRELRTFRDALCRAVAGRPEGDAVAVRAEPAGQGSIVPLLHTCGHLWQPGDDATALALSVQEKHTQLYSHERREPVYKTETSQSWSSAQRRTVTSSRRVVSHYVSRGTDSRSRVDFTLTLNEGGAPIAALSGIRVLGDRWYHDPTGPEAVEPALVVRKDTWLLTVPEALTYPPQER